MENESGLPRQNENLIYPESPLKSNKKIKKKSKIQEEFLKGLEQ